MAFTSRSTFGGQPLVNSPYMLARFEFHAGEVTDHVERAAQATMDELAGEIQPYLVATLHRWTGEMADASYATVERVPEGWLLHAGSNTDHTLWHELRYHPQLRETMDRFGPLMGPRLAQHL